jgi:pyruvate,water dikinase
MANTSTNRFPYPNEFQVPKELEGWEEMYPPHRLFSKDREEWEKAHFWYQDKIHAPEPMYPLDDIFHEAWQIALSQYTTRVFCIPPAQGVQQRMLGGYMYISAVAPPPGEVIQEKAALFGQRVPYTFQNYEKQFVEWLKKFKKLGQEMEDLSIPQDLGNYVPEEEVIPLPKGFTRTN